MDSRWQRGGLMLGLVLVASSARLFAAPEERDPFWPVGYQHTDPVAVVTPAPAPTPAAVTNAPVVEDNRPDPLVIERLAAELQVKIRARLRVNGFMKSGGQQLASVNGQVVGAGEKLAVLVDGTTYRFRVTAISPTAVKLEPLDQ